MISYYYQVNISTGLTISSSSSLAKPVDDKEKTDPPCIYLSFNSTNKMYENQELRTACQVYTLEEVSNRQAILPLDYKKLGKVSSSPLVKVNVFLNRSVPDSTATDVNTAVSATTPGKGVASTVLPVKQVKTKKFQIIACTTGSSLYKMCTTILDLRTLKLDEEEWTIKRVAAIDRLKVAAIDRILVDVRN